MRLLGSRQERITKVVSTLLAMGILGAFVTAKHSANRPADELTQLETDLRLQLQLAFRHDTNQLQPRIERLDRVMDQWDRSVQSSDDRRQLSQWLRSSIRHSMPGSPRPMPAPPVFGGQAKLHPAPARQTPLAQVTPPALPAPPAPQATPAVAPSATPSVDITGKTPIHSPPPMATSLPPSSTVISKSPTIVLKPLPKETPRRLSSKVHPVKKDILAVRPDSTSVVVLPPASTPMQPTLQGNGQTAEVSPQRKSAPSPSPSPVNGRVGSGMASQDSPPKLAALTPVPSTPKRETSGVEQNLLRRANSTPPKVVRPIAAVQKAAPRESVFVNLSELTARIAGYHDGLDEVEADLSHLSEQDLTAAKKAVRKLHRLADDYRFVKLYYDALTDAERRSIITPRSPAEVCKEFSRQLNQWADGEESDSTGSAGLPDISPNSQLHALQASLRKVVSHATER